MQRGDVYRAFLASPGDVAEERELARKVVEDWNAANSLARRVTLEVVGYETHAQLQMAGHPQDIINEQLLGRCDFLIGVFWTRLGTPTNKDLSGTVSEIITFGKLKPKDIMLFFSERRCQLSVVDPDELHRLNDFKKKVRSEGLYKSFKDLAEYARQLRQQLDLWFNNILKDRLQTRREITVVVKDEVKLDGKWKKEEKRQIQVHELSSEAAPWMNAVTFHRGMEILYDQMRRGPVQLRPDLFVGINHGGLMAATYLEARFCGKNAMPIGIVKTGYRDGRKPNTFYLQPKNGIGHILPSRELRGISSVLIVDSQIKSGKANSRILRDFHKLDLHVYSAVLVACGIKTRRLPGMVDRDALFGPDYNPTFDQRCYASHKNAAGNRRKKWLPDFVAFISRKGVKPPEGIP